MVSESCAAVCASSSVSPLHQPPLLLMLLLLRMPQTTGCGVWRAEESGSCRTGLRQALANQRADQRTRVLGRDQSAWGAERGGVRLKLTHKRDRDSLWFAEPSWSLLRPDRLDRQGKEGRVEQRGYVQALRLSLLRNCTPLQFAAIAGKTRI